MLLAQSYSQGLNPGDWLGNPLQLLTALLSLQQPTLIKNKLGDRHWV